MLLKKIYLVGCLCLLALTPFFRKVTGSEVFAQQDAQYNQYMFNQLALNPAFAGSRDILSIIMMHRNQWTGIAGAPTTGSLTIQMPLKNRKVGVGAEITSDRIG